MQQGDLFHDASAHFGASQIPDQALLGRGVGTGGTGAVSGSAQPPSPTVAAADTGDSASVEAIGDADLREIRKDHERFSALLLRLAAGQSKADFPGLSRFCGDGSALGAAVLTGDAPESGGQSTDQSTDQSDDDPQSARIVVVAHVERAPDTGAKLVRTALFVRGHPLTVSINPSYCLAKPGPIEPLEEDDFDPRHFGWKHYFWIVWDKTVFETLGWPGKPKSCWVLNQAKRGGPKKSSPAAADLARSASQVDFMDVLIAAEQRALQSA